VKLKIFFLAGLALLFSTNVKAQTIPAEPDSSTVRVHFGPLWLNPSLALTNLGVDTNVFNAATANLPQRDFTYTVTPQSDLYLRMGRTWLIGNAKEDLVWYQKFSDQRSVNGNYTASLLIPLTRMTFDVGGNFVHTRERPGYEIDTRPRRTEKAVNGAVELRALSKTFIGARGERRKIDYDSAEVFLGSNLQFQLARTITSEALTLRHKVTPLTSLTFDVGKEQERFDFSPIRDSNSTRINAGVSFDRFALITGSAQFGYRNFKPLSPDLPVYTGSTAQVSLSYSALGSTKLGVTALRDLEDSYDINQPYYLQSGINASIAQQIYGPLDVQGRIGAQRLAYLARPGVVVQAPNRVDHVQSYGVGVGYRLGRDLRFGVNVDEQKRQSVLNILQYDGLRYGVAITYGQ
jgi:putative beta-barrel porin BBP2